MSREPSSRDPLSPASTPNRSQTSRFRPFSSRARFGLALGSFAAVVFAYACTLTDITGVPVGTVTINPPSVTIVEGASVQLSAQATDQLGGSLPIGSLTWSVGDPNLLSISATGLIQALQAGQTTVRATLGGVSGTVPVTIEPGPTITVSTQSLEFMGGVGPNPPDPKSVDITNSGGGTLGGLSATVEYGQDGPTGWLSPGLAGTTAPTSLTVSILSGSLSQGTYTATVLISSPAARNSPVALSVQLDLTLDQPVIVVEPTSLQFQVELGDGPPAAKNVKITNAGGGDLTNLQALVTPGSWLSAILTGTDAPAEMSVQPDPAGLGIGIYNETVLVRSNTALNEGEVAVTLEIVPVPVADLSIAKTGPNGSTVGDTVIFVLTSTNAGPEAGRDVVLVDSLPAGLQFVRATDNPTVTGREVRWDKGNLAPSTTVVDTIWTVVTGEGSVSNIATISGSSADSQTGNNRAVHPIQLVPVAANLVVQKTGPATAGVGETVQYDLRVVNGGPNAAENVVLTDSLPAGMASVGATNGGVLNGSAVTWDIGTMDSGAEFLATISVEITTSGSLTNVARVASTTMDPAPENNRATATTGVGALADLSIVKTFSPLGTRKVGEQVTYTLVVSNDGPTDAGNIVVSDELPTGVRFESASNGWNRLGRVVTWDTIPNLAVGADTTLTIVVTLTEDGTLRNTATVASPFGDPDLTNNDDFVETVAEPAADVSIVKTATDDGTPVTGEQVTYELTVTNNGLSDASDVAVSDTLPTGVTFVSADGGGTEAGGVVTWGAIPTLASGADTTFTVVVTIDQDVTLTNIGAVTATTFDPDLANNADSAQTVPGASADIDVQKTGDATATAGTQASYTVTVTNNGPDDATDVVVTDVLPSGVTFSSATGGGAETGPGTGIVVWPTIATLANGANQVFTVTVDVDPTFSGAALDSAFAAAVTSDPDMANDTATFTTTVSASADVSVTKVAGDTITAGEPVTYTITVTNNGPSTATNIAVADTLPAGTSYSSATPAPSGVAGQTVTWTPIASLAPGASSQFTVTADVDASTTGTIDNKATALAATADPTPGNNVVSADSTVYVVSDLEITKDGPDMASPGDDITYTLTVENLGPSDATGVVVTDPLPSDAAFVSSTGGTYNAGSRTLTWNIGDLANGATQNIDLVVTINAGASGAVTNTAAVTSTSSNPASPGRNSHFKLTSVGGADLNVTKSVDLASANPGNQLTYTVTVRNDGPSSSGGIEVRDTLPVGVTLSSATGSPTQTGRELLWGPFTPLAVGNDTTFTVIVDVDPGTTGELVNVARTAADTTDFDDSDDRDTATTALVSAAQSTATVPNGTAGSGTTITVQANDVNGSPLTLGGATVSVSVTGANTAGPIAATDNGDGTYTASYTPTATGTDDVAITLNGGAISGSPYSSTVSPGAAVAAQSTATVPDGTAGTATTITVQAKDANGNDLTTGGSTVSVSVTGANTAGPIAATDNGDGTYTASYTPTAVGTDDVAITLDGGAISGSPYSSTVGPGAADAAQSTATVPDGTAGTATTITVQAKDANGNDLTTGGSTVSVSVTGANTAGPIAATDNGDGTYTASYTPTTVGDDDVAITLDGGAISGSPYTSTVSPGAASAANSTATVPDGTAAVATTITVQAKDANDNDLTSGGSTVSVSVTGANTAGPIAATDNGDGTYTASYTPTATGTDDVAITLDGGAISGSPYSSTVTAGGAVAAETTATVPAGTSGSLTTITIQGRDAGGNPVSSGGETVVVTVSGANAAGPITATDNGDGTYTATYTPLIAGTDDVAITLGGAAIKDSPYSSVVGPGAASAGNSTATVPAGTAGSATTITVQAKDANDNDLTSGGSTVSVSVTGANTAGPIAATDNGDGTYTASYTPTTAGTDDVAITLDGGATSGSPYSSTVSPGAASAANSTATVPNGTAAVATTITVQAKDANDNDLTSGGSTVSVSVTGANTAGPITATDNGDGTYTASYTPTATGTDDVAITLDGGAISGSPYSSTVTTGGPVAAQSTATVPDGTSGIQTTVTIQARDAGGNPVSSGGNSVVVTVSGANASGPTTATDNGDGTYTFLYTPIITGTDDVAITLDGGTISGSPYTSTVGPGAVNAARSVATVPDGTAGSTTSITVQARDQNDNNLTTGGAAVSLSVSGANTAGPIAATDNADGTYSVSYDPTVAGTDNVAITLGGTPINSSPYSSTVSPGAVSAANSTGTVPAGTAGSATSITVQAKDANDNDLTTGGATVSVSVTGANTAGPIAATDNGDGTYSASYTPTTTGTDDVAITLDGGGISGSPFSSTVSPGAASASNSTATVPNGTAGSLTTVTIQAKDANDNNLTTGGSAVIVSATGANLALPSAAADNGDGTYTWTYTPTATGTDDISISLDSGNLTGSPFASVVSPGPVSPGTSTATVPNGTVGAGTTIIVQAKDANGNNLTAGGSTVVVNVSGANTAGPLTATDNLDGTYTTSYTPTAAGTDDVAITLDGVAISGSPYSSTVTTAPGPVSPPTVPPVGRPSSP